jgi:hypothetical protein
MDNAIDSPTAERADQGFHSRPVRMVGASRCPDRTMTFAPAWV